MRCTRRINLFFAFLLLLFLNTGISPAYGAAPVISEIGSQTTKEDTAITVAFTINDNTPVFPFPQPSDDDEDTPVTVTAVSDNRILIPNANIVHSSSEKNHTLTITPAANQYGTAMITVTADDGSYSSMKSFQLTVTSVNDAPVVTVPNARTMEEDKIFVFGIGAENTITVADADAGENKVEMTVSAGHGTLKAGTGTDTDITGSGTSSLKLTGTLAQITNWLNGMIYTPASNWHGSDTVTVTINDKGHSGEGSGSGFPFPFPGTGTSTPLSDTKTISFTVTPVNDPLSLEIPQGVQVIDEDTDLAFSADKGNAVTVTDPDGIYGEFEAEMQVETGTLEIPEDESGDLTVESDGEGHLLLRGVLSQINAALSGLIYKPEPEWYGEDTLTVTAMDLINSETKTGEISIKVNSVNDAPVLNNIAEIILSSVAMNAVNPPGIRVEDMTENVLTDADEDDEPGIAVVSADNSLGTWQYSVNDGTNWAAFDADISVGHALLLGPEDLIRFLPAGNQIGKVSLSFRGWDQTNEKTAGTAADTGQNGGSAAFSQQIASASLTVVNTPPGVSVQANAGTDQEVTEGATVTLNGSQSEIPEGAELSIEWIQENASVSVTIADAHSMTTSFTAPEVGTEGAELVFTLKLTDADGNTWTDTVLIKVKDSTVSPGESVKAEAGADQEVTEGTGVTLSGSGSLIPAGVTPVYKWEKISGPDVTLSGADAVSATFTAPDVEAGAQALLVFRLTVSDSAGNSSTDIVTVKVNGTGGTGQTLVAEAGADQEVTEGTLVTLNASGSFIPAGATVAYKWEKISGLNVILSGADAVIATFTAPDADSGTQTVLVFRLTITDSAGNSNADTVTVKVNVTDSNQKLVAEAGANQEVAQGTVVVLNGSGSFIPAGVTPFYKWEKISGQDVSFSSPNSVSTTFVAPNVDSGTQSVMVFRLTVSDSAGNSSTDTVIVKVNGSGGTNQVPVAEAGANQNVKKGDTVTLNGMWSYDPDGIIVTWQWKELSNSGVTLTTPANVNTTFTAPSGGTSGKTLTFELTVTDNVGQQSKDTITVYVAADNAVPGDDDDDDDNNNTIPDVTVKEGGTVTLKGSQAGNFGSGATYSWRQVSGTTVQLSDPNAADPTFVTPPVGSGGTNLVFELTVTEGGTQVYKGTVTVGIQDNGIVIVGAPEGVLTFKPVTTVEMGISVGNNAKLIRLVPVDPVSITDTRNRPESMIYGLIRMEIRTAASGDTVPVTLYLNNAVPDGYRWYKHSEKNGWSDFSANTVISADRKQITLTLTDGGAGDSDGLVNGMIIDPSGLGKPASGNSSETSGGGDGDGGSCFVDSACSDLFRFLREIPARFFGNTGTQE